MEGRRGVKGCFLESMSVSDVSSATNTNAAKRAKKIVKIVERSRW